MFNWTSVKKNIKDLKKNPKNPRIITKQQQDHLDNSLKRFGLVEVPAINLDDTIISGHQRIALLKKQGHKIIDCRIPDRLLEEKDFQDLGLMMNRVHGDFDYEMLANMFEVPDLIECGFTVEELQIGEVEEIESNEEDNEVLEPEKDEYAITKLGDLYELNDHRLICGDSTLPDVVNKLIQSDTPILMVTDPPYGVEYDPSWRKDIKGKHGVAARAMGKVQNDDKVNWALAWHLFPGCIAYVWHASLHTHEVYKSLIDCEYEIISNIIWKKQHFALSRGDYHWQHEPCWYAVKKEHPHNWQGSRKECTVWEISNLNAFGGKKEDGEERTAHSTQKPIECMAKPIRNNTAKGEGVYDPFAGSGTTLIAAEQLGRISYNIELSPAYCDIIVKRWIKWMQKKDKTIAIKKNGKTINIEEFN